MPRKRSARTAEIESKVNKAIEALKTKEVKSPYAAAKLVGLDLNTLTRRLNGGHNHAQSREQTQLLSIAEENALALWCRRTSAGGCPIPHRVIREMAWEIMTRRVASVNTSAMQLVNLPTIGKDWVKRFLHRYPRLKTVQGRRLEFSRGKDTTIEDIQVWFTAFQNELKEYDIEQHNVYNMDETGFAIGTSQSNRVVIDGTLRTRYKIEPGRQEWVTAVECICADGSALPPLVIFKGQQISSTWIDSNIPWNWQFGTSPKGWTSNEHGMEWIRRVFEPATREKANGKQRLLICDGHDSHISGDFLAYCYENQISLLVMPPHSSHLLQPADIGVFGPLATYHGQETDRLTSGGVRRITKAEWVQIYFTARQKAFTSKNIASAWRGAGLYPLNRQKVLRHLPISAARPTTPTSIPTPLQLPRLSISPLDKEVLGRGTKAFKSKVSQGLPLSSPSRQYAVGLAEIAENLATQVSILEKHNKMQEEILNNRKAKLSGKRMAIKGHLVLSTKEIVEEVKRAEKETLSKKRSKKAPKAPQRRRKRKRHETPSEDEEGYLSEEEGNASDCIVVGWS
jgi:hypothetical protein